jgi:hypothetical protein
LTVDRREHLAADSSNAAALRHPASSPVDRAPSIQHARPWAVDLVVRVDPEAGQASERAPDLADLRVQALVVLDPAHPVAHLRRLKLDARSALHRAAVRVVSSSIRRLKKGQ